MGTSTERPFVAFPLSSDAGRLLGRIWFSEFQGNEERN